MKCWHVSQDNYISTGKLWKSYSFLLVVIPDCDTESSTNTNQFLHCFCIYTLGASIITNTVPKEVLLKWRIRQYCQMQQDKKKKKKKNVDSNMEVVFSGHFAAIASSCFNSVFCNTVLTKSIWISQQCILKKKKSQVSQIRQTKSSQCLGGKGSE